MGQRSFWQLCMVEIELLHLQIWRDHSAQSAHIFFGACFTIQQLICLCDLSPRGKGNSRLMKFLGRLAMNKFGGTITRSICEGKMATATDSPSKFPKAMEKKKNVYVLLALVSEKWERKGLFSYFLCYWTPLLAMPCLGYWSPCQHLHWKSSLRVRPKNQKVFLSNPCA